MLKTYVFAIYLQTTYSMWFVEKWYLDNNISYNIVSPLPPKGILYSRVRSLYLSGCGDGHGG